MVHKIIVTLLMCCAVVYGEKTNPRISVNLPPDSVPDPESIDELKIEGAISGRNITFTLEFDVDHKDIDKIYTLISGDVVLDTISAGAGRKLHYDLAGKRYNISWKNKGKYHVKAVFAARSHIVGKGPWRQSSFTVPSSRVRKLSLVCDRTDLEVRFPGALRVERNTEDGKLKVSAILGSGKPFVVEWKPQVQELDGELVMSGQVNTITTVSPSAMRLDSLFMFDISQGKIKNLKFQIPPELSITQVNGNFIRTWNVTPSSGGKPGQLEVELNKPQDQQYMLQVVSEVTLGAFPSTVTMPVIVPEVNGRISGYLMIGTQSAIKLVMNKLSGLSQIDRSHFPVITDHKGNARPIPSANGFFYNFASVNYGMVVELDDIVPSYDVSHRVVATVREDDLVINDSMELEIRDAPLRDVEINIPEGFVVASLTGNMVDDFSVLEKADGKGSTARVHLTGPAIGRLLINLRVELGQSPLGDKSVLGDFSVTGAGNERGWVVLAAEQGVQIDASGTDKLREIRTGSAPMQVPDARLAFKFRDRLWELEVEASKRISGVRVEQIHLISIGEGICYGSIAAVYHISGAPVDELHFRIPDVLENVEFVGSDVRRWDKKEGVYTVKLSRKVIGDYNLGVLYTCPCNEGEKFLVGGVSATRVEMQRGYIALASHLNLKLEHAGTKEDKIQSGLLSIGSDELPANYKLLVNAPILRTWKYVRYPHQAMMLTRPFDSEEMLPVVIDVMELHSDISVADDDTAESVTSIRYKIKNASRQFLSLKMPGGTKVWSTHIVRMEGEQQKRTRIQASFDQKKQELLIPLDRKSNPNDPVTIDLEYGCNHGKLDWGCKVLIEAPQSDAETTFTEWKVSGPKERVLNAGTQSSMLASGGGVLPAGLPATISRTGYAWIQGLRMLALSGAGIVIGLICLVILICVFIASRRMVPVTALLLICCLIVVSGAAALFASDGFMGSWADDNSRELNFSRPLSLGSQHQVVEVSVIPEWRSGLTTTGIVLIGAAVLLLAVAMFVKKLWRLLLAAGISILFWASAEMTAGSIIISHLLTWVLPILLLLYMLHLTVEARRVKVAASAAMILLTVVCTGCEPFDTHIALSSARIVDRVECVITAEKDCCQIDYKLTVAAAEAMDIKLTGAGAVLMSDSNPVPDVSVYSNNGLWVRVEKPGIHTFSVEILKPLPEASADMTRQIQLPLPPALTNSVQLTVPKPGMDIESPTAARLTQEEVGETTVARAIFAPGDLAVLSWKPRARQTATEKTVFFSEVDSLVKFDKSRADGIHRLRLQISQGQVNTINVRIPDNMIVTNVSGANIGTWRFNGEDNSMVVRLNQPATGRYVLGITTQTSGRSLPWKSTLTAPFVQGASRHRGSIALTTSPSVFLSVKEHPQKMNTDDFARMASVILKPLGVKNANEIRHAFRLQGGQKVVVEVFEVLPEIRTSCEGSFSISDERMKYNGTLTIDVAKAGVFMTELKIPADFDIDTLSAAEVSHWDEVVADGIRTVKVHFKKKLLGMINLKMALSCPISDVPENITVPRIDVTGQIKHTGKVYVSSEQGLRLSIAARSRVSELNPAEIGISKAPNTLAFRILGPEWKVVLATETVKPRVTVDFLHVADVSDARVNHTHYIRYTLAHAGKKYFTVRVPASAIGVDIEGADIANKKEVEKGSGIWKVELTSKRFDRPYQLTIHYETRFDMSTGKVSLEPVIPQDGDLYHGNVVVRTTNKVQLIEEMVGQSLRSSDPRSIDGNIYGSDDLTGAVYTYRSPVADYQLSLLAQRHGAAELLEADVKRTVLTTVVNTAGQTINRAELEMRVGTKRFLHVQLPGDAAVWSLLVNNTPLQPSRTVDKSKAAVLLIPLGTGGTGKERDVKIDLIYIYTPPRWELESQNYSGPKFDLPLKEIKWVFYLPEGYDYDNFEGTLKLNEETLAQSNIANYGISTYESLNISRMSKGKATVKMQQNRSRELAEKGFQREAKQVLVDAYNNPFQDSATSEDVRVELHNLNKQQAMVALKGRRAYVRPGSGLTGRTNTGDLGDRFTQLQAQNELNALSKDDSDNLEQIVLKINNAQEAAAAMAAPLAIELPASGRKIELTRKLQVIPMSDMAVGFTASSVGGEMVGVGGVSVLVCFACALALLLCGSGIKRRFMALVPSDNRESLEISNREQDVSNFQE